MREVNAEGLELIKSFESFRSRPYNDGYGYMTVGWGHRIQLGDHFTYPLSSTDADVILNHDLDVSKYFISKYITSALNDNQYAALVSLVFNCGYTPLRLELGQLVNSGHYSDAAEHFLRYNLVDGVLSVGLTKRREAERQLFLRTI